MEFFFARSAVKMSSFPSLMYFLLNIAIFLIACIKSAESSRAAYSWIVPNETRLRFIEDIDFIRRGNRFGSDWSRLSVSPNEAGNIAAGPVWSDLIPTSVSLEEFEEAFTSVVNSTDDCFETLVYFAFRPSWYTPLRSEILRARECLTHAINRIPIAVDITDDDAIIVGSLMADAVSRLLRVLYTDDADEVIGMPETTTRALNGSLNFDNFINQSEVFRALLPSREEVPHIEDIIDRITPIDAYYLGRMSDALYNNSRMIHFPDFLDSVLVDLISMGIDSPLEAWLFKLAASKPINFGELEIKNHMRKFRMVKNPGHLFQRRARGFQNSISRQRNAFRQITAGSVQHLINQESRPSARACMPVHEDEFKIMETQFPWYGDERDEATFTIYMYYLMERPKDLLRFCECILSAISNGIINPPNTDLAISGFGFLTRMVTSTDAFFLRHM